MAKKVEFLLFFYQFIVPVRTYYSEVITVKDSVKDQGVSNRITKDSGSFTESNNPKIPGIQPSYA